MTDEIKPRRSAGMRGSPASPAPEHGPISNVFKARPQVEQQLPVAKSRYARPKILMGEVTAPPNEFAGAGGKGEMIAAARGTFRAFMQSRRLTPTTWAREAGVSPNEILAFLSGRARQISMPVAQKLAAVAKVTVEEMFR